MAESTDRAQSRWRCPACGTVLNPLQPPDPGENRLICPDCGGLYRIRVRAGEPATANFSGEVPAIPRKPPAEPPVVSGLNLLVRSWMLRGLAAIYPVVNTVGASVMMALGGFVPVGRGWLSNEVGTWSEVVARLGGVPVSVIAKNPDAGYGPVLARRDAPVLIAEVADVARRLGARAPDALRLAYLPCCGVVASGSGRSRTLLLGLPLLYVLSRIELRAVLAHEMAHLERGDATIAARTSRFVEALGQAVDDAPPTLPINPLRLWARTCRKLADRLLAPVSRGQEARADRVSAGVAGGPAAAGALVKVAIVQPLFREVLAAYDPDDPDAPNLYSFFRQFWSRLPESLITAIRHQTIQNGEVTADPAHPALLDRLAVVQVYPARPGPESDHEPASSLVGDLEALEQMLHNRLFAPGSIEPSVFHRTGS